MARVLPGCLQLLCSGELAVPLRVRITPVRLSEKRLHWNRTFLDSLRAGRWLLGADCFNRCHRKANKRSRAKRNLGGKAGEEGCDGFPSAGGPSQNAAGEAKTTPASVFSRCVGGISCFSFETGAPGADGGFQAGVSLSEQPGGFSTSFKFSGT